MHLLEGLRHIEIHYILLHGEGVLALQALTHSLQHWGEMKHVSLRIPRRLFFNKKICLDIDLKVVPLQHLRRSTPPFAKCTFGRNDCCTDSTSLHAKALDHYTALQCTGQV